MRDPVRAGCLTVLALVFIIFMAGAVVGYTYGANRAESHRYSEW